MKNIIKHIASIGFVSIVVCACVWIVFEFILKLNFPIIILPVVMIIVLFVALLAVILEPIINWWMS